MKLVCISDTHRQLPKVEEKGDIFIHSGDFSLLSQYFKKNLKVLMGEFKPFIEWLGRQNKNVGKVLFVPGNHDYMFENFPDVAQQLCDDNKVIWLKPEITEIDGLKFLGYPCTPTYQSWAFERGGEERAAFWEAVQAVDVIVAHGPAWGIRDYVNKQVGHLGCKEMLKAIDRLRPKLVVHGHIHEGYGQELRNEVLHVNASYLDGQYDWMNPNKIITVEI